MNSIRFLALITSVFAIIWFRGGTEGVMGFLLNPLRLIPCSYVLILLVISPLLGFLLGLADLRITDFALRTLRGAQDISLYEKVEKLQNPYRGKGLKALIPLISNALGEECVRGAVIVVLCQYLKVATVFAALAAILFIQIFRPIPLYARPAKVMVDIILTLLFAYGGLLPPLLAHTSLNLCILYPIMFRR